MFKRPIVNKCTVYALRAAVIGATSIIGVLYLWYIYGFIVPRIVITVISISIIAIILFVAFVCKPSK